MATNGVWVLRIFWFSLWGMCLRLISWLGALAHQHSWSTDRLNPAGGIKRKCGFKNQNVFTVRSKVNINFVEFSKLEVSIDHYGNFILFLWKSYLKIQENDVIYEFSLQNRGFGPNEAKWNWKKKSENYCCEQERIPFNGIPFLVRIFDHQKEQNAISYLSSNNDYGSRIWYLIYTHKHEYDLKIRKLNMLHTDSSDFLISSEFCLFIEDSSSTFLNYESLLYRTLWKNFKVMLKLRFWVYLVGHQTSFKKDTLLQILQVSPTNIAYLCAI